MRLGLKPPKHDLRTLKLARYLTPALGPVPETADWASRVPEWPMYRNDELGCCAIATVGHQIQAWTANDGVMVTPPEQTVIAEYLAISPNDDGCVMLDVLNKWRRPGLCGRRIGGFAAVTLGDHHLACAGVHLFGGILLGMALPTAIQNADEWRAPSRAHRWGPWAPGGWGGHAINAVKYDQSWLYFVSWGKLMRMSWTFYDAYCQEAYVAISSDWLGPDFKAPNGLDLQTLGRDLAHFR